MPIKGVGIDLIRIHRVARAYRRRPERFLRRIFSRKEIEILQHKKNLFPSLAARFAAKESIAKALGCGIGTVKWVELEILPGDKGQPIVFLHGNAGLWAEQHRIKGVEVSMSHDGPYAVAKAIAYGDTKKQPRSHCIETTGGGGFPDK